MKQPKLSDLRIDREGTKRIRAALAQMKTITFTINLDVDNLEQLRQIADEKDVPSHQLLNQIVREGLLP